MKSPRGGQRGRRACEAKLRALLRRTSARSRHHRYLGAALHTEPCLECAVALALVHPYQTNEQGTSGRDTRAIN
eukprot:3337674-Pleurochrysis_carterae.AAC.2